MFHIATIQHHQAIAKGHGLNLIMGHIDRGHPQALLQFADFQPHLHPQFGIQVRQGFVKQEHLRIAHDGPPHGNPLTLATGQLPGFAVQILTDFQNIGGLFNTLIDLSLGEFADLQPVSHVFTHAHMRIKRVVLEHHGDIAL